MKILLLGHRSFWGRSVFVFPTNRLEVKRISPRFFRSALLSAGLWLFSHRIADTVAHEPRRLVGHARHPVIGWALMAFLLAKIVRLGGAAEVKKW